MLKTFPHNTLTSFSQHLQLREFAKLELPLIGGAIFSTKILSFQQTAHHQTAFHFEILDIPTLVGFLLGLTISWLVRIILKKNDQQKAYPLLLVESLAAALDERDEYTFGHARRVTNLSLQLADQLNDQQIDRELLRLSCILHDIGKIGISDTILLKPGKLTKEEFAQIQKHPNGGARILHPAASDSRIKAISHIIRHHHERFDGLGYPSGLSGEKIPLLSRIIALADSYDAMTSDRPYRKGMACEAALSIIEENTGSQFDPDLAPTFVNFLKACQQEGPCPKRDKCQIFVQILNQQISKSYESQYCQNNYKACARYKITNKALRPSHLLPDGSMLLE